MKGKKRRYFHFIVEYYSRSGQFARYGCRSTCSNNAVISSIIFGSPTPFFIERVVCLENVLSLNNN